jgi:hypothetical protein
MESGVHHPVSKGMKNPVARLKTLLTGIPGLFRCLIKGGGYRVCVDSVYSGFDSEEKDMGEARHGQHNMWLETTIPEL